jgi:excisionase family DNA binding protein
MSGGSEYLRAREVAELLGVSERTVRRWIAEGTLPSTRIGGARLLAKADLERLLGDDQ